MNNEKTEVGEEAGKAKQLLWKNDSGFQRDADM